MNAYFFLIIVLKEYRFMHIEINVSSFVRLIAVTFESQFLKTFQILYRLLDLLIHLLKIK